MKMLVTGGCGYIGSHVVLLLLEAGHDVVVVDNLSNSSPVSLERVAALVGREATLRFVDLRDAPGLDAVFEAHAFDAVLHFAGLKAVGESVSMPLAYWDNNVTGTLRLLDAMKRHDVRRIVFSSSATVYGPPETVPLTEDAPVRATNPYGQTKLAVEMLLHDLAASDPSWAVTLLRYFNPIGAHPSGRIGEDPRGIPNNLLPYVARVAAGSLPRLTVHGDDWDTTDGTGVRDYVHVMDLAAGHVAALGHMEGLQVFNLGTGRAYSVLEVVRAFEAASGREVPYVVGPRRSGDIAACWADPGKALRVLGWKAERDLDEMCRDHWAWQVANPDGYGA